MPAKIAANAAKGRAPRRRRGSASPGADAPTPGASVPAAQSGGNAPRAAAPSSAVGADAAAAGVAIADAIRLLTEAYGPFANEPRLEPAHELVFTILSQHTADRNSERAFRSLMQRFGTLDAVADASVDDIEDAIAGGGLAKVKAPRIKTALCRIRERNGGSLDLSFLGEMPMGEARAWLRQLPGIGPKSAGIVLSFSLGMPAMAVDTHIYRVSRRLGFIGPKVSADQAHEILEAAMPPEDVYPFHAALITHGRQVCKAQRPLCGACVVGYGCPSRDEAAIAAAVSAASAGGDDGGVGGDGSDGDRPAGQAPGRRRRGGGNAAAPAPSPKSAPTPVPHTQAVKELQP